MRTFPRSGKDPHDVALFHHQHLFTINGDFGAGPLAKQDLVASFYGWCDQFAAVFAGAFAN